jgi:hypothetical protein
MHRFRSLVANVNRSGRLVFWRLKGAVRSNAAVYEKGIVDSHNFRLSSSGAVSKHSNSDSAASISITPREKDYSQWYLDVIAAAQMAENSPVKGCMIIRPWGMAIWDTIRDELNTRIKATGAENASFPLFIPLSYISKVSSKVDSYQSPL